MAARNDKFSQLVLGVVTSLPFQMKQAREQGQVAGMMGVKPK
jgi:hypothetical protein